MGEDDGAALQRFSDYLNLLDTLSTNVKALKILDSKLLTKRILTKLPRSIQDLWIEQVISAGDNFPPFSDFANFIECRVKVSNHSLRQSFFLPN